MKNKKTPLSEYSDEEIFAEAGRRMRSRNPTPTPKLLRPCPTCGEEFGAREMRKHTPRCPGKLMKITHCQETP